MSNSESNIVDQVRQFNEAAGNTVAHFNPRQAALYFGLQCEELAEKLRHLGFATTARNLDMLGRNFKDSHYDDLFESAKQDKRADLMDDDIDILVVTLGSLFSMGVDVQGAINEVHRSNMSKLFPDGTMHKDANGKVIKPTTYSPPDLVPFLGVRK